MLRKFKFLVSIAETEGFWVVLKFLLDRLGWRQIGAHFVSENTVIASELLRQKKVGVMVDVGAHVGSACKPFYTAGWHVLAYEPDHRTRQVLARRVGKFGRVRIDSRAVADKSDVGVDFFSSAESDGIHGLSDFHSSHFLSEKVEVTTLATSLVEAGTNLVDYLKIDTEGNDLRVLQGLDWGRHLPDIVMCEFEDVKSSTYGYSSKELYSYLSERYSTVLISEWHRVVKYGTLHRWRRVTDCLDEVDFEQGWGNFIAFSDPTLKSTLITEIEKQAGVNV